MRCCRFYMGRWVGGWMGGWVGGWTYFFLSMSGISERSAFSQITGMRSGYLLKIFSASAFRLSRGEWVGGWVGWRVGWQERGGAQALEHNTNLIHLYPTKPTPPTPIPPTLFLFSDLPT